MPSSKLAERCSWQICLLSFIDKGWLFCRPVQPKSDCMAAVCALLWGLGEASQAHDKWNLSEARTLKPALPCDSSALHLSLKLILHILCWQPKMPVDGLKWALERLRGTNGSLILETWGFAQYLPQCLDTNLTSQLVLEKLPAWPFHLAHLLFLCLQ